MKLHVAGTFEFLVDKVIHTAAGINQAGGDDGQAPSLFDITGGAEETLGRVQGGRVDTKRP